MDELTKAKKEAIAWMVLASEAKGLLAGFNHWINHYSDRLPTAAVTHYNEIRANYEKDFEVVKQKYIIQDSLISADKENEQ